MFKRLIIFLFLFIFILIFVGCLNKKESNVKKDGKLIVYIMIFLFVDFVKKIGGDYVNVEVIYLFGVDLYIFELS